MDNTHEKNWQQKQKRGEFLAEILTISFNPLFIIVKIAILLIKERPFREMACYVYRTS